MLNCKEMPHILCSEKLKNGEKVMTQRPTPCNQIYQPQPMMTGWLKHQNREEPNKKTNPNTAADYNRHRMDVDKSDQMLPYYY
jgi:hypothetical protein